MNQYPTEAETAISKEGTSLMEDALKSVWDKIRLAAHLITQLREEKRVLTTRVGDLDRQIATMRSDVQSRDQEIKRLRSEHTHLLNANGHNSFTREEKDSIKVKIRDLISKINSYL